MKIKEHREKVGISRAEMARMFEIPIRTLENWESEVRTPPMWAEKLIIEKLENMEKKNKEENKVLKSDCIVKVGKLKAKMELTDREKKVIVALLEKMDIWNEDEIRLQISDGEEVLYDSAWIRDYGKTMEVETQSKQKDSLECTVELSENSLKKD